MTPQERATILLTRIQSAQAEADTWAKSAKKALRRGDTATAKSYEKYAAILRQYARELKFNEWAIRPPKFQF